MFDFDVGKLLVFGIVALAVIPPKDLPRVMRTVGQDVGKMRRMAAEFQGQFMEAMREADLESVKKEIDALDAVRQDRFHLRSGHGDAPSEMTHAIEGPQEIGHSEVALTGAPPRRTRRPRRSRGRRRRRRRRSGPDARRAAERQPPPPPRDAAK